MQNTFPNPGENICNKKKKLSKKGKDNKTLVSTFS